jgi:cytochrome c553
MSVRPIVPALLAAAVITCLAVPGLTQEGSNADADKGRQLSYTCYGCHGIDNYKNVYPTYSVPKLQGQHADYLVEALKGYKGGDRAHSTMHAQAASMKDQDMRDIATFLGGKAVQAKAGATPAGTAPAAAQTCVACHGADGVGITPLYPTLSGQHADYLERALQDYKNGSRKNAVMASFASQLSEKDIKELAKYYSKQKPSLSVAKHANWFKAH